MRFLPRHGRGHKVPPSAINFRANIDALKRAGVTDLVSVSACGSLKEECRPGTSCWSTSSSTAPSRARRASSAPGCVAHVSMADPVSPALADLIEAAAKAQKIPHTRGGTYLVMEGPQFSTRAESKLYRSWGCDVIGMTNMPEAKLAREAEICYATVAMVTDYDCWHAEHAEVDVPPSSRCCTRTSTRRIGLIERLARDFPREHPPCPIGSDRALDVAIITPPEARDPALLAKLDAVAGPGAGRQVMTGARKWVSLTDAPHSLTKA